MNTDSLIKEYNSKSELVEFFSQKSNNQFFLQHNNELKTFSTSKHENFSVRMLVDGAWGYASTSKKTDLNQTFLKAFKLAQNLSKIKKKKIIVKELPVHKDNVKSLAKKNPFNISEKEKINFVKDFNKKYKLKIIKSADSTLSFSNLNNIYKNSLGAEIIEEKNYSRMLSTIVSNNAYTSLNLSVRKGYEFIEKIDTNKEIQKMQKKLKRLSNARAVKPGKYNLLIDPALAGTFFHEAVGHALEADLYKQKDTCLDFGNQFYKDLTLLDDPTLPFYWGSYAYDSEGTKSSPSTLIKNGKVINFINDKSTFFELPNLQKTANGRFDNPHNLPLTRMSNTVVMPGNYSKEELTQKLNNGLIVKGFAGGAVEPLTGVFSFKAQEAFVINNGEKTTALKDVTLSGDLKQILNQIIGIGKKYYNEWNGGMCGKSGQSVPVSEKIPYIAVRGVSVGN